MPATIKEIAKKLGLNPSTVSRAISGSDQVSEATRQEVLRVARKLNYTPNLLAQSLVGSAQKLIGCQILEYTNPFFVPMVRAIEDLAGAHDYIIFLGESRRQIALEESMIERFRRVRVAGVIVMPVLADLGHLLALKEDGIPVVLVGRDAPGFHSVNVNNEQSGYLVGKHLNGLGHRRIGMVFSGKPHNAPEQARLSGLRAALAEAGTDLAGLYEGGNNRLEGGRLAADQWLAEADRPTAVFAANDLLAMGFTDRLGQAGVRVPDDVAVVGHDDIPFADLFSTPLTTIVFPKYEMGRMAMQILLDDLCPDQAGGECQHIVLEPALVVRRSCGAGAA